MILYFETWEKKRRFTKLFQDILLSLVHLCISDYQFLTAVEPQMIHLLMAESK